MGEAIHIHAVSTHRGLRPPLHLLDKRRHYVFVYSISFIVVALITLFVYPSNGRSMVWSVDGLEQYYPFFVYEGQWLRSIAEGVISGQGLHIPLWSAQLGYGSDIVSTLDTFFDPLNILSAFVPERFSEYAFQFLVVFRLYLAGLTFSLFVLRMGAQRFPALMGALLYALCGTALEVGLWPASAWPLILFPLVLWGAERMLGGKGPLAFILSMAAFFIISYYFSYMACLFLIPYCAVRVVQTGRGRTPKAFMGWTLKFAGALLVGLLLASFALVPSLMGLLGLDRFTHERVVTGLLYPLRYYPTTVAGFVGTALVGSDCYIGFGGLAFLSCVALFLRRRAHTILKVAFVVMTLMLLLPAAGRLFNGLNYATNRWVWVYALLVCFIVVRMLPGLLSAKSRDIKILGFASVALGIGIFLFSESRSESTMAACVVLVATLFIVAQTNLSYRAQRRAIACCVVASLAVNAFYFVSPDESGVGANAVPLGTLYKRLTTDSPDHVVSDMGASGLWRYDGAPGMPSRLRNDSLVLGLKGIDFYNSSYNSYIDRFHTELGLTGTEINFSYKNLGGRSILESLAGVRYYLTPTDRSANLPCNYNDPHKEVAREKVGDTSYSVYEGSDVLPLAYLYSSYIPREEYEALSPAQKQESLLQGVVLDHSTLPQTTLDLTSRVLPTTLAAGDGLHIEGGVITVDKPNATLTLTFPGLPDSETYLNFSNLNFRPLSPLQTTDRSSYDHLPWFRKAMLHKKDAQWQPPVYYGLSVTSSKMTTPYTFGNFNKTYHMYGGKKNWLVNLGYSQGAQTQATISFAQPGEYDCSDLSAVCQPMGGIDGRIDALKASPVTGLSLATNSISAVADCQGSKAMYFSIPYSAGWHAWVDGKPTPIQRANTGFMAVELTSGHHSVTLKFMTPGLPLGLALSGLGIVLVVGGLLLRRFHRRKRKKAALPAVKP